MKRSRFSEEQIIAVLKEQEAGMAAWMSPKPGGCVRWKRRTLG